MTAESSDQASRVGQQVGDHRLVRFIGAGGMGEVYEAEHTTFGTRQAIKFLRRDLARRLDLVARFEREARIAANLQSQHIIKVRDFRLGNDGMPYMVMDLAEGRSLAHILAEQGRLTLGRAVDLAHQVCVGLCVAHAAQIVHRDLKPDNLYVGPGDDGTDLLKILDFGIAKQLGAGDLGPTTATGTNLGTAHYMSPEQAQGARRAIDHRTDIYSLGVVLYEMLAGRKPYEGESYNELLIRIVTQSPVPLDAFNPDLPPELVSLVHRAMAREPADRFRTALEFADALARLRREGIQSIGLGLALQPATPPRSSDSATLASGPGSRPPAPGHATPLGGQRGGNPSSTAKRERRNPEQQRPRKYGLGLLILLSIVALATIAAALLVQRSSSTDTQTSPNGDAALPAFPWPSSSSVWSAPTGRLVTSARNAYWNTDGSWTEVTGKPIDVVVDDSSVAQTWEGFGGAFSERAWDTLSTPRLRAEALALLFGSDGCRFTWGRIPIGANDYAIDRYTLDENPGDYSMSLFSIERDRQRLIPYLKAATAINPSLRFWANPWTPPTWMKIGQKDGHDPSPFDGGSMRDDDATLKAYARYFVKFVQHYASEGIKIEVVAPQNEPSYEQNFPSCRWAPELYARFVGRYLGPAFDAAGVPTKIMLGTMSNQMPGSLLVKSVMDDSAARGYVKMLGLQWNMLDAIANMRSKGLPMWQTEHKAGNYFWQDSYEHVAPNDHAYGVESWGLIRDWIRAGVSMYSAWNMVLDKVGKSIDTEHDWAQNALLVADGDKLIQTPAFFVFRHLSHFVVPGAKVMGTIGGDALAFRNPDGSIVTVMYHSTSAKNFVVLVGGKMLQFDMPGDGWATLKYGP